MSLLSLVQSFARRTGLTVPTAVIGAPDAQTSQLQGMLEEEGQSLASRFDWEALTFEATHTTVATEAQGVVTTLMPNGYDHIRGDTIWDRTEQTPLCVIDGRQWQGQKAVANTGPNYQIRIRGGQLLSTPAPPAGNTWAWEYVSLNWVLRNTGAYSSTFYNDNDTMLLPEPLLLAGLRWRWKKEKGFDYAEDFETYERLVSKAAGHDGLPRTLSQGGGEARPRPGVVVPQGSWPL
jgi:hypothetical protein